MAIPRNSKCNPKVLVEAILADTGSRDRDSGLDQSSRDFVELIPGMKERPNEKLLAELIDSIRSITNRDPRPRQVLALYLLLNGSRDVLFQAATGYGKSMI